MRKGPEKLTRTDLETRLNSLSLDQKAERRPIVTDLILQEIREKKLFRDTVNQVGKLLDFLSAELGETVTVEMVVDAVLEQEDAILQLEREDQAAVSDRPFVSHTELLWTAFEQWLNTYTVAIEEINYQARLDKKLQPIPTVITEQLLLQFDSFGEALAFGEHLNLSDFRVDLSSRGVGKLQVRTEFIRELPELTHVESEWVDIDTERIKRIAKEISPDLAQQIMAGIYHWELVNTAKGLCIRHDGSIGTKT